MCKRPLDVLGGFGLALAVGEDPGARQAGGNLHVPGGAGSAGLDHLVGEPERLVPAPLPVVLPDLLRMEPGGVAPVPELAGQLATLRLELEGAAKVAERHARAGVVDDVHDRLGRPELRRQLDALCVVVESLPVAGLRAAGGNRTERAGANLVGAHLLGELERCL